MVKPSKDYNPFCFPYLDTTWSFYKDAFFFLIASFIPFFQDSSLLWIFSVFFGRLYAFLLSLQKVSLISLSATCKNVTFVADSFFFLVTSLLIFIQWPSLKWWESFFCFCCPFKGRDSNLHQSSYWLWLEIYFESYPNMSCACTRLAEISNSPNIYLPHF